MNIKWRHHPIEESTWLTEKDIHDKYPHLIENLGAFFTSFILYFDCLIVRDRTIGKLLLLSNKPFFHYGKV